MSNGRASVCPIDRQQQRRPTGLLLSAGLCGGCRSIDAGAVLHAPALSSKCGWRHVESRRRRLNTDFFYQTHAYTLFHVRWADGFTALDEVCIR